MKGVAIPVLRLRAVLCALLVLGISPAVAVAQSGAEAQPAPAAEEEAVTMPPSTASEQYDAQLRELEEKVVTLKEKIFRSKTRLLLLKERILNDVIAEAKVVIHHVDDMGSSFRPIKVHYRLDGESLRMIDNTNGELDTDEPVEVFSGNVGPGNHSLTVEMVYRGDSMIFTYLRDYLFKLRASYTFYATKGKITTIRSSGFLKGDITYNLTDRPSIKFQVSQTSYRKEQEQAVESSGEGE
jgi:hypothetical protein